MPRTRLRSRRDERTSQSEEERIYIRFPASLLTRQENSTEDLAPEIQSNTAPSSSTETLASDDMSSPIQDVPRDATNSTVTYSGQTSRFRLCNVENERQEGEERISDPTLQTTLNQLESGRETETIPKKEGRIQEDIEPSIVKKPDSIELNIVKKPDSIEPSISKKPDSIELLILKNILNTKESTGKDNKHLWNPR
ncbi:hypothetical protein BD560DRAFT_234848 [Blakeslea trispora]|nr:hypothetical protein BD560DRAFT_234848 [Blakeslea trispora]